MSVPQGAPPPGAPAKSNSWIVWVIVGGMACLVLPAVIGCLAAIAIPNFLKFQCKSKQSEAKTNLSGLFTAEKAFYGEYNFYSSDLVSVNWAPDGSPSYVYGFASAGPSDLDEKDIAQITGYDDSRKDTSNPAVQQAMHFSATKMVDLSGRPLDGSALPSDTGVEREHFLAGAAGDIDPDSTTQLDVWTIDETKMMTVVDNDCAN